MKTNKSIVLIIDSLVNAGAETTNIRLAEMFRDMGYIVHLIIIKNKIEINIPKNIFTHILEYKKDKFILRDIIYSNKLKKILNLINNKKLIIGSLGLSHKLMNKIDKDFNFYYALHGNTTKAKLDKKKGLNKFLKKIELKKTYSNKNLITVSDAIKKDILSLKIKIKSIQTIYNPFDFNKIKEKAKENIDLSIPNNYIVHVGRFAKVKRHDLLLNAFSKLKNKNLVLVLVGDGEEKENIKQLIKELKIEKNVILTGFLKNPYPLIKNAKLLVLSSENEGFGNVLIESLILNTKIVSTNTIGPTEIMHNLNLDAYICKIEYLDIKEKIEFALKEDLPKINIDKYKTENIIKKYKNLI